MRKPAKLYTLLALLLLTGSVTLQAQRLEPVEIFESPMIVAYHFCQWNEKEVLLNANVLGDGRYIIRMDEDGNGLEMDSWLLYDNTCSFLTESKFFRNSNGEICFYYVKGPDRPILCKVTILNDFELTTFEFPDPFPIPEEIPHDQWWDFEWLPNDDGSVFVSSSYLDNNMNVHVIARYNASGELTHQWTDVTNRVYTSLLPPKKGNTGCRLVMEDLTAKDVNSECVIFDDSLNVVDIRHCIYSVGIYRPTYEFFAVHPETDMVYLISNVSFPAFNGNPKIGQDVYMSQFTPDFTQTKYVMGPYTVDEHDQKALCEAIAFRGDDIYMCGLMNMMDAYGGSDPESVENFYVALLDGNLNLKGEIYYHNDAQMLTPFSIHALPSGGCLVSTSGYDRQTFEQRHSIFKLSDEIILDVEEAHAAGFAVAIAYPNPGGSEMHIRTAVENVAVEVYDMNGRLVAQQPLTETETVLDATNWAKGAYVWKVLSGERIVEGGKWVKE
ncbi:MAG: T9SS type A sorting domain-containing protein [Bacteroidales bacterium]|nr:T9SS type A sorting domain-containing protein [Bacteroidales bacterium]